MPWKHPQVLGLDLNRSERAGTRLVHLWENVFEQLVDHHNVALSEERVAVPDR